MHPTDDVHARGAAMVARACRDHDGDPLFRFLWTDAEVGVLRNLGPVIGRETKPSAAWDRRRAAATCLINEADVALAKALDEA